MIKSKRKLQPNEAEPSTKSSKEVIDFFDAHFNRNIDGPQGKQLMADAYPSSSETWRSGGLTFTQTIRYKDQHCVDVKKALDIEQFAISEKLIANAEFANGGERFDEKQMELYQVIGRNMDMYAVGTSGADNYKVLYTTHALDHILKTRTMVIANKKRLDDLQEKKAVTDADIEKARDQGLARPKVLILCPFRKHAHQIVQILTKLMFGEDSRTFVDKSARFEKEFGDNGFRIHEKRKVPEEFRELMKGNVDDCFRIGITVAKKALRLFTTFDESDILICSPIGLRMIVGEESEKHHEHDFLASIELVVVDHADIFLMQNWEHLTSVFETLHKMPETLKVDISRVRQWSIDQYAKIYRQTLMFASYDSAEFRALFAQHCQNYAGLVTVTPPQNGHLDKIRIPICQEIHRFPVPKTQTQSDARFNYFIANILPKCEMGTMIFVSSYFDYVRLRNYLKRESESFVQLHEYATDKKISRARGMFFGKEKKMIMMTERFHYYRHYVIKGVKSYVFYQLPLNPTFYHEIVNDTNAEGEKTVTRLIFNKFDAIRLRNTFGAEHAKALLNAQQDFHVLMSE